MRKKKRIKSPDTSKMYRIVEGKKLFYYSTAKKRDGAYDHMVDIGLISAEAKKFKPER